MAPHQAMNIAEGIQRHPRRSERLQRLQELSSAITETSNTLIKKNLIASHGRKRDREQDQPSTPTKRHRSQRHPPSIVDTSLLEAIPDTKNNPVGHWIEYSRWSRADFEDDQTQRDLERGSFAEKDGDTKNAMSHLLARRKSSSSLRGKRSRASSVARSSATISDQGLREVKSSPYQDARYESLLEEEGSFMGKTEVNASDKSRDNCQILLESEQKLPVDSVFDDPLFEEICEMVRNKNEARVVRDILPLIVPSAEGLALRGSRSLKVLIESVNEGWNNSIPVTKARPQPDYSVGFRREAFTKDQLKRLKPYVGDLTDTSFFMATYNMYFPFMACEVKCGAGALEVADRQNAHSMTLAVRGVVELFRLAKRETELHREILAFSVSHDHSSVRIYGHYPLVEGSKATFYRYPIHKFDFTALEGKEKWTAYKFTKNVYEMWMPAHLQRICSAIDELPHQVFQESEPAESGLSQGIESHNVSDESSHVAPSLLADSQSSPGTPRDVTPDGSSLKFQRALKKRDRPTELHH